MPVIVGLFRSAYELEKAVMQLMSHQFEGTQLTVTPMHLTLAAPRPKGIRAWLMNGGVFGDTIDRSDGTSVMDGIVAGATIGGLLGVIGGSAVLPGPIALGVVGIMGGGFVGWLMDLVVPENRREEYRRALKKASTLLHIECRTDQEADAAMAILKENQAHEVGRVPKRSPKKSS